MSPGPFTRCGTLCLEDDTIKIFYTTGEAHHTVFIRDIAALTGNRNSPPVPVMAPYPAGDFVKVGYAHRSPSGRALIISTTSSDGDLSVEWSALQRLIRRQRQQVQISRLNTPLL